MSAGKFLISGLVLFFLLTPLSAAADSLRDEIRTLRERIDQLEKKVEAQDMKIEQQEAVIADSDSSLKELEGIRAAFSGLEISIGATSVVQGSIGNDDNIGHDDTDATYSVDIEISSKIGENGIAMLHIEAGEGSGLYDELSGFSGPNADAIGGDSDFEISELWYEHRFKDTGVVTTFGKLDVTRWFDTNAAANDENSQFLADVFVNNIAVEFPDYAYGGRLTISLNEISDISFGALEADSDFEDIFDENFLIAEIDFRPIINRRQGNYRIYGWHNSDDKTAFADPSDDRENGYGLGLSIDQEITNALTVFTRFGWQDDDVYEVEYAWSFGLQLSGCLWGREEDMFGIAYGRADIGEDYQDCLRAAGLRTAAAEDTFEAYYRFRVNDYLTLSPDIQFADNMAGMDNEDSVFILGMRAQVDF